jgi:hypothetical protein
VVLFFVFAYWRASCMAGPGKMRLFVVCILFFCLPECIRVIDLKHERAPVSAFLAEVNLADISPGNREDLLALTVRAVKHGQQLYMRIRYKN